LARLTDDDPFRQTPRGRSAAATPKTPEGGGKGLCGFARGWAARERQVRRGNGLPRRLRLLAMT